MELIFFGGQEVEEIPIQELTMLMQYFIWMTASAASLNKANFLVFNSVGTMRGQGIMKVVVVVTFSFLEQY